MRYACMLGLLAGVIVANVSPLVGAVQRGPASRPQEIVLQAPDGTGPPTRVGLLYTPEVIASLAASSAGAVPARIAQALRDQTPIVVLWTIPPPANAEPWPRPFRTVIVDRGVDSFAVPSPGQGVRIEPLWIEQHADDLRQLDRRTPFADVGVMAGYPLTAFVPGRIVTIYRSLPPGLGRGTGVERYGVIEWNGTAR